MKTNKANETKPGQNVIRYMTYILEARTGTVGTLNTETGQVQTLWQPHPLCTKALLSSSMVLELILDLTERLKMFHAVKKELKSGDIEGHSSH
ncbi:hypothetical protein TNCV_562441 [Trichonephila clavipes]|nr:hypothetical protein TNCV_562441 [Trichonephila clavipes]